jgi:signal transduction histidine kinase/AraC-like DNA-binding protein/CheY-like chemotaxis protein/ligand-binding sensor domain-containing protein
MLLEINSFFWFCLPIRQIKPSQKGAQKKNEKIGLSVFKITFMKRGIVILILNFWMVCCSTAQSPFSFKNVDLGYLNDYSISYELDIDKDGIVWIATEEGLLRYNSKQSFLYNEYQGLPASFSGKIQNILVDSKNKKWASSESLLARLDQSTNKFIEVKLPESEKRSYIYDLEEYDNQLWVASFGGLLGLDLVTSKVTNKLLEGEQIQHLSKTNNGLIIGTAKGSYFFNKGSKVPQKIHDEILTSCIRHKEGYLLGSKNGSLLAWLDGQSELALIRKMKYPILDLITDRVGNILIATDGDGIYLLSNDLIERAHYSNTASGGLNIPNNGIYDLHVDNENELWVTSYGGGVFKSIFDREGITNKGNNKEASQRLINNYVKSILKTKEGDIWYGTKQGFTIYKKNGQIINKANIGNAQSNDNVLCLHESGEYIWVGTYGNGAYKVNKNSLSAVEYNMNKGQGNRISTDKIYAILHDDKANTWFGGIGGALCKIEPYGLTKEYSIGLIRSLIQAPDGRIYGTSKQGVFYIQDEKIIPISILSDRTKFDYSTVNCLAFYEDKILVGSSGDGIIIYSPKSNNYAILNMENGLPSDVVQGIVVRNDEVWVSTSRGLVRIKEIGKNANQFDIFDERDGFHNATFNYGAIQLYGGNELLLGTIDGASIVDLNTLFTKESKSNFHFEFIETLLDKDKPNLQKINLFGIENKEVKLAYWQNFIKINFATIRHQNPEKIRYSWKMDGVKEQWSPPQSLNEISIANLSPGDYNFKVKIIQNGNQEEEIHSLDISISPPWWRSIYAILFYILAISSLLYGIYVFFKTYLKKQNLDEQIQFFNNITHELKTPLSILLNKLNNTAPSISATEDIKLTVLRMNTLFDQLLNFNKVSSKFYQNQPISKINIDDQFNTILHNFKQELERKNIAVNFENVYPEPYFYYKKDVMDKICYNIISNAVKYTGQNGTIQIKIKQEGDAKLVLIVTDNGIGIPKDQQKDILKRYYRARNAVNSQESGTGLGLMMVKSLLDIDGGNISFISEKELGTAFTITMANFRQNYIETEVPLSISYSSNSETEELKTELIGKPKILIVEDNDELRIDMVEKLSEHFSIIAARNGKEGYEKALSRTPDLIVTDLIMPEIDGMEMCRMLQKDDNTNHIPLFMMTVLNDSANKVESIKSGVNTFLNKPVDIPYLIAQINHVLEYKEKIKKEIVHKAEVDRASQFKDDRSATFIKEIEEFILEKVKDEEISVQDICKHIGMSRTALYMKMKEILDQSPQNFIIITKMNHARDLLLEGGRTVQEIAFMVGFNNPKYFSTSFKKQFGMSPTAFLKSLNPE